MAADTFGSTDSVGEVQIASEAVTAIAAISAAEVNGVTATVGNSLDGIVNKLGGKKGAKGVKVEIRGNKVTLDLDIEMEFGYSIPKISAKIQDKVAVAIDNMTGLEVEKVNVHVVSIASTD